MISTGIEPLIGHMRNGARPVLTAAEWRSTLKAWAHLLFFLLLNSFLYNHHFKIGINLYFSDLLVFALLALTLFIWMEASPGRDTQPWLWFFFLLFAYYLFLAFYAYAWLGNGIPDIMGRFRHLYFYLLPFLAGLVFTHSGKDGTKYFWFIRIHVLVSVVIGVLSLKYPGLSMSRIYLEGELADPRYFMVVTHGTALLCCLLFVHELVTLATRRRGGVRPVFFLVVALVGILGSQNRSVLITFLLMAGLVFLFGFNAGKETRKRMRVCAVLTVALFAGFSLALMLSPLYAKFQDRITETIDAFSGKQEFFTTIPGIRVGRTIATYREWLKSPVIGCGWGSQITEFQIYDLEGNYIRTNYGTPHNYYITILYQAGVIGFMIMMAFLGGVFWRIRPAGKMDSENVAGYSLFIFYAGFLVFNIANTLFYGNPVFIPVCGYLLGAAVSLAGTPSGRGKDLRPIRPWPSEPAVISPGAAGA